MKTKEFLKIAVTSSCFFPKEAEMINLILKNQEADFVHIRKPFSPPENVKNLIAGISSEFHPKLKLHDHFELIEKFNLGGVHLNSRNPIAPGYAKRISISIHSLNEIPETVDYDYFFISPVFDSISKSGYKSAFSLDELSLKIKGKKAVALGGVTPDKFKLLEKLGFYGGAMLGHFFPSPE